MVEQIVFREEGQGRSLLEEAERHIEQEQESIQERQRYLLSLEAHTLLA